MRIWHDDVRPAPKEWVWCKTNLDAIGLLAGAMTHPDPGHAVTEISLDHDLGADASAPGALMLKGLSQDGSGYDLVRWMIQYSCVPPIVRIHSWNPAGASRMAQALRDAGHYPIVEPFTLS